MMIKNDFSSADTADRGVSASAVFADWLVAYNSRLAHHWDRDSYLTSVNAERCLTDRVLAGKVETAADVAAVILASSAFGEFDLPDRAYMILDEVVQMTLARKMSAPPFHEAGQAETDPRVA